MTPIVPVSWRPLPGRVLSPTTRQPLAADTAEVLVPAATDSSKPAPPGPWNPTHSKVYVPVLREAVP